MLLGALTVVRLVVAATAPLSPDEAYYWVWSRALAVGYLDHPPMVALWIRAGTWLGGETALGVRLLAPLAAAAGSVLLARAADALFPGRGAGLWAAVLLNATLMLGAGAVTMTPDTPLLFFWTAALWAMARIVGRGAAAAGWWWLVAGLAAGLALDSKYTAALLGVGAGLWLLTPGMRWWLRTPWPWVGGVVAALVFAPVVAWNAAHGWASFIKQGGRTGDWAPSQALRYLAELVGGQVGLATPVLFVLFVAGTGVAVRRWRAPEWGLLAAVVVPGAALFIQHALGDRVQANWVAVLYPGAALAAAGVGSRWIGRAAALGFVLTGLVYAQATLGPLQLGRADPTLRLAGYAALADEAGALAQREGAGFLASEEYGVASLLAWGTRGVPVLAAGARWTLFDLPAAPSSQNGLLLLSSRRTRGPDPSLWLTAEPLGEVVRRRGPVEIERFRAYRVTLRGNAVVLPPRR